MKEKIFAGFEKMDCLRKEMVFAVACSGGGDSMALTLLAERWRAQRGWKMTAITVDHGLRPGSATEARQVGKWLKIFNIEHVILHWKGKKSLSNLQEEARKARYRLLTDYCKSRGIETLMVAHTLEDQAETFLLRLARGSGVDGLSAMAAQTTMHGVTVLRPLLDVKKSELIDYLTSCGQAYITDPSNENPAYDRVKMRKAAPMLAQLGLTQERLAKTAAAMARARGHLEEETQRFLARACAIFPEGYALLRTFDASEEIALRAVALLIMTVGGCEVRPRLRDLERLYTSLKTPGFKGATLCGCIFAPNKDAILICREPGAVMHPIALKPGETASWDNRFEITNREPGAGYSVGALTQGGWLALARKHKLRNVFPTKKILYALPALRNCSGDILAVPQLGYGLLEIDCRAIFPTKL